jgi:ArsR family transcriptional regulator, lead/cadmium/zinc/bismuth-responsive transcriptional repressor
MYSDIDEPNEPRLDGPTPIDPERVAALQTSAPSGELIAVVAGTFQALGDPTRLKMLYALSKQSCCVRDLGILAGVTESAVSHHLRLLKDRKLVKSRREGTTIYYSLANQHLAVVFREAEYHADHVSQDLSDHPYA